ncbi:MAG: hypothetical protein WC890_07250 [Candidatus Margulisiibacteriota bacterium]
MPRIMGKPVSVPRTTRAIVPARKTLPKNNGPRLSFPDQLRMYNPINWIGPLIGGLLSISQRAADKKIVFLSGKLLNFNDLSKLRPVQRVKQFPGGAIMETYAHDFIGLSEEPKRLNSSEMRMLESAIARYLSDVHPESKVFLVEFSKDPAEVRDFIRYMIRLDKKATNPNGIEIFGCKIRLVAEKEMQPASIPARIITP